MNIDVGCAVVVVNGSEIQEPNDVTRLQGNRGTFSLETPKTKSHQDHSPMQKVVSLCVAITTFIIRGTQDVCFFYFLLFDLSSQIHKI